MGTTDASQDISFKAMCRLQDQMARIVLADPAVETLGSFVGAPPAATRSITAACSSLSSRATSDREKSPPTRSSPACAKKPPHIPGITLILQAIQDIRVGGRMSKGQYQYTPCNPPASTTSIAGRPCLMSKLKKIPQLKDVNSDQQTRGLQANVVIDRDAASRLGVSPQVIDDTLYDAFGQRQVSTVYKRYNQHHVVLEVDPAYLQSPDSLHKIFVKSTKRQDDPAGRGGAVSGHQHLPLRQPSGPVPRRHHLLQSRPRHVPGPGHRARSSRPPAN